MQIICKSPLQTQSLAKKLAEKLSGDEILALEGQLGSGKTTFVQGLAEGLKIKEKIQSPTFVMLREYPIPNQPINQLTNQLSLVHIDLYRLKNFEEAKEIGIEDYLGRPDTICVIEWAEKIKSLLVKIPTKVIWIEFKFVGENERKIKISKFK